MYDIKALGIQCKRLRRTLDIKQSQVAIETGYSQKSISAFENGRTNNALILLWYINHGLNRDIIRGCKYGAEKSITRENHKGHTKNECINITKLQC